MIKLDGHVLMISMNQIVNLFINKNQSVFFFFFLVRVSVDILKVYLNMSAARGNLEIQWSTLRYLIGDGKFFFVLFLINFIF
jgi:hypothetical protein